MNRNGFTLLEILLAIVLASVLLSSIYGVFSAVSMATERVEKQATGLHLARVLTSRLNRELLGLAIEDSFYGTALTGGLNSRGNPFLDMLTSSSGGPGSGMRRVSYRLAADQDDQMTLWRAESAGNYRNKASEERLAKGIERLEFNFFDGQQWRKDWNSLEDGLPVLVRVEIALLDLVDRPPLQSVFELPQKVLK